MTVRQMSVLCIRRRSFGSVSHALLSRTFCSAHVHVDIKLVLLVTAVFVHQLQGFLNPQSLRDSKPAVTSRDLIARDLEGQVRPLGFVFKTCP